MMKIKTGGVRGIQSHNNREKPPLTNPDVDISRAKDNYNIVRSDGYQRKIKQVISDNAKGTKTVRKDAVVLCNFLVTSDEKTMKEMSPETQRGFFEDSKRWFACRYGEGNIVNATVHMDETTPHMHLGLVPVVGGRLSAKALFDRKEMRSIQTEFYEQVGKKYGLERGIEGSERTHLSEQRFKALTASRELERTASNVESLRSTENALKVQTEAYKTALRSMDELPEGTPSLIGHKIVMDEDDYIKLVDTAEAYFSEKALAEVAVTELSLYEKKLRSLRNTAEFKNGQRLEQKLKQLEADNKKQISSMKQQYEREKSDMRKQIDDLKKSLSEAEDKYYSTVERINSVFDKYPQISDAFFEAEERINEEVAEEDDYELDY